MTRVTLRPPIMSNASIFAKMSFHLHDLGLDPGPIDRLAKEFFREIGKADGSDLAFFYSLLDVPVSCLPVVGRLMEEKKIHIICLKTRKHFIYSGFFFIDCRPELGDQEDLLPGHTALFDPSAGS